MPPSISECKTNSDAASERRARVQVCFTTPNNSIKHRNVTIKHTCDYQSELIKSLQARQQRAMQAHIRGIEQRKQLEEQRRQQSIAFGRLFVVVCVCVQAEKSC